MNINQELIEQGWCWLLGAMREGGTVLEGLEQETQRRGKGCGPIRSWCPREYCGRHESPPVETLHGLSLLISLAPLLLPSYAVALLIITYGGIVQDEVEEAAEQELELQLPV